jgi:D-inositol-3-phosphate glycosyltransferase
MRIALVSEHASPLATLGGADAGGQNVHVAALAVELGRLGHDVVVHTRRDDAGLPRTVRLARRVLVDHIDAGPPEPLPKDDLLGHMGDFADQLRQRWTQRGDASPGLPPDIVHAHFWMSGLASLDAALDTGIPVVQTFHALGVVKRRYQGAADTSPPGRIGIERRLVRDMDHIIATSTDEVFELRRMGLPPHGATVVPCGVDTTSFTPAGAAEPRRDGLHRVLCVGRLVERKGVQDLVDALPAVPGTELVVAGGPERAHLFRDPVARRLRARAEAIGVADRVDLRGSVTRDRMPALLRSADVVVCAPWYEPFGIVPLEAMACGVPVVVSSVGGLTDTVVAGVTGLHVPPRSPVPLAHALRALLQEPELRRRMGAAGTARVRRRYRWPQIAQETLAVYRRVLDHRPAADRRIAAEASR